MSVDIFCQFTEQHAEQRCQQRTGEIESLGAKVVSVVELSSVQCREQQSMNHVAEEVCLLRVLTLCHRDMRQHLFLQDLLGVIDTSLTGERSDSTTPTDEVKRNLSASEGSTVKLYSQSHRLYAE